MPLVVVDTANMRIFRNVVRTIWGVADGKDGYGAPLGGQCNAL